MADERNTIEIILKARDETAAAFASLAAKLGLAELQAKKTAQETENLTKTFDNLAQGTARAEHSFNDLQRSYGSNQAALGKNVSLTKELADAHVAVERATKSATAARDRDTHSVAEEAVAQAKLSKALDDLEKKIKSQIASNEDLSRAQKKRASDQATIHVQTMRDAAQESAILDDQKKKLTDLATQEEKNARARAQQERERKAATASDVADIQRASNLMRDYETQIKRAAKARDDLRKGKLTDVEKIRVEIDDKAATAQAAALKKKIQGIKDAKINVDLDSAAFDAHAGEVEAAKEIMGRDIHINVDADIGAALTKLGALEAAERSVSNSGGGIGSALGNGLSFAVGKLSDATGSIAAFDNTIRGLATFMVVGFLQPLIVLGGSAAGALLAIGSAAIYAGGALGGALVSGIAQAIPVLGVVALAVGRIAAVFGAAKQAQTAQDQATTAGIPNSQKAANAHNTQAKAANTLANSTDSLKSAEEGLANAHRNVGVAEDALGKARQQAKRDLQDMVLAEKEAQLQAEQSALAQKDAAGALTLAIRQGGDVQRAQLDVQSAALDQQRNAQAAGRAQTDLGTAQRQGVEGAPGVVAAKKQVDDAKRSVDAAELSVERAKRSMDSAGISADQAAANAGLAGQAISAAAGKADLLAAKLSPAEQKLLDVVKKFKDAFLGFSQFVTEPIINSVADMMKKVIGLMDNNAIRNALRGLSSEIATQATHFFDAFTNPAAIKTFLGFVEDARKNLVPVTNILIDVGKILLDIARAAAPSFGTLLKFIQQVTDGFLKFTSAPKGQTALRDFFAEGTKALIAFLNLGGAVVKLFLAIAGPGGGVKTGVDLINGLTKIVNDLADAINKKGSPAWKFFHDLFQITMQVIVALGPLFTSLGDQFGKLFSPQGVDSIKAFVNIFANILIPALGEFIGSVGRVVAAVGKFLDQHPKLAGIAKDFLFIVVAMGFASKAAGLLLAPFQPLFKGLDALIGKFGKLKDAAVDAADAIKKTPKPPPVPTSGPIPERQAIERGGAGAVAGEAGAVAAGAGAAGAEGGVAAAGFALPPVAIVAGLVAVFAGLLAVTGNLKPVMKAIGDAFDHIVNVVKPKIQDFVDQIKDLFKAFEGGKGAFAIIKPIVTLFTQQVLIRGIKAVGDLIADVFGGIVDFLSGFVELITGILTLNPQKMLEGFEKLKSGIIDIFRGIEKYILTVPTAIIKALAPVGKKIIDTIWDGIQKAGKAVFHFGQFLKDKIVDGFNVAKNAIGSYASNLIHHFWDKLKSDGNAIIFLGKFIGGKIDAGLDFVVDKAKGLGKAIVKGIVDGANGFVGVVESVINDVIVDPLNALIKAINKIHIHIPKVLGIGGGDIGFNIPTIGRLGGSKSPQQASASDLQAAGFAHGGPITGYGGGDIIPARLEPGEHVLTKEEVRAAGGHGAIFALRRILGGGTQGGPRGYQAGGAAQQDRGTHDSVDGTVKIDFNESSKEVAGFVDKIESIWNGMWKSLNRATNNNTDKIRDTFSDLWKSLRNQANSSTNNIEHIFGDFSNSLRNTVNTLTTRVINQFDKMRKSTMQDASQLVGGVKTSLGQLQTAVFQAMSYVGTATNESLKSFQVDPIKLTVEKPKGLAGGGYVGQSGERGRDAVMALLGRGEAVLNWGHQKLVEPALRATYGFGLDEMFNRTRGYHAGGQGQEGFASGGFVRFAKGGQNGNGSSGGNVWEVKVSQEAAASGTGWTELSPNGNAAGFLGIPHSFSNSVAHFPDFASLGRFFPNGTLELKIRAPNGRTTIANKTDSGDGSSFAPAIGITPALAAELGGLPSTVQITRADGGDLHPFPGMAKLISGTGGFAAAGPGGLAGVMAQEIEKIKIKGSGALHTIAQAAADKIVEAANKYIAAHQPAPTGAVGVGGGPLGKAVRGSPRDIIDRIVLPIAAKDGIVKSVAQNDIDNANHGPTVTGTRSDHQGPPDVAWAADMSNSPPDSTPEEAELAVDLARRFGLSWSGAGITNATHDGYRFQMLHNTMIGGNHYNHVHFGVRVTGPHTGSRLARGGFIRIRPYLARGGFAGRRRPVGWTDSMWEEFLAKNPRAVNPLATAARGGFAGSYDVGGELPGSEGQPIPIIAHAQEWILNKGQQKKVAKWLGTSRDRLKGALGFTGGPKSFAGGGDPKPDKPDPDEILDLSLASLKLPKRGSLAKAVKAAQDILDAFAKVGGLIEDAFNPGDVRRFQTVATRINAAVGKLNKATLKLDPKGKDFSNSLDDFLDGVDQLTKEDSGVLDQLAAAIETHTTQMATRLSLAQTGLREVRRKLTNRLVSKKPLTDIQAAAQAVVDTETTVSQLGGERRSVANDLQKVNQELGKIRQGGVTDKEKKTYERLLGDRNNFLNRIDDIDGKLAQARQDLFTNTQAKFQAQTDKALANAQQKGERTVPQAIFNRLQTIVGGAAAKLMGHLVTPDTLSRIGTALGRTGMVDAATNEQLAIYQDQQKAVEQRLKAARAKAKHDPRWQKTADDLEAQLQDLTASIVETQAQALQQRVDEINNQATRRQTAIDLFGRIADIQEKAGDPTTAARTRLSVLQGTGQNLLTQRAQLQGALQTATVQNNTGQMQALGDQINDLSVQIAENTQALSDQVVAIRQVSIDAIQNRASFQTGIFGGLGQLVQQIATNTVSDTSKQQAQFLQQTAAALQQQAAGLAQQLLSGFGINLTGLSGTGFATAVSGLNFDKIEGGMTTGQKGQFEALIQALIDAQNAIEQNTGQLDDLNGTLGAPQAFSSSAWQFLRMAVFTGAGQLLPQFQIPQMQSGGFIKRSGIFQLHAGEFVVNPQGTNVPSRGDVNVTVHEAGPETDYTYLANRIAFAARTPST